MGHVFYRNTRSAPPKAVGGQGVYLFDAAGKRYLDASGGAAVSCLGHNDPDVIAALKDQIDRLAYAHTGFFTTEVAEDLADILVSDAPGDLEQVYFVSGGSEAMEAAMKMARQYFLEVGQPQRCHFIARRQSYHGNTLGALAIGGNAWRRQPYEPLLAETHHIAPCYAYRDRRDDETDADYGLRVADELEAKILELGPDTVCAFVAEPVVGATAGAVPAVPGYFQRIREICDRHGLLLILDEVMCGMGRTGTLFACEQEGIAPDLLITAKGLAAGYQPIGAVLVSARVYDAFQNGSGAFQHGHTYMGHAAACAAGLAVQRKLRDGGLLDGVIGLGNALDEALHMRFGNHPHVGDIRGRGLFRAIELVANREDKAPFDPGLALNAKIKARAFAEGLVCYPMGGTVDGRSGDHVLLAPPFVIDETQIDECVDKLGIAVDAVLAEV